MALPDAKLPTPPPPTDTPVNASHVRTQPMSDEELFQEVDRHIGAALALKRRSLERQQEILEGLALMHEELAELVQELHGPEPARPARARPSGESTGETAKQATEKAAEKTANETPEETAEETAEETPDAKSH